MIKEHDMVVLTRDLPSEALAAGDLGTVVHCYADSRAYEVEFVTGQGETLAVLTLRAEDIRLMNKQEILHARNLAAA